MVAEPHYAYPQGLRCAELLRATPHNSHVAIHVLRRQPVRQRVACAIRNVQQVKREGTEALALNELARTGKLGVEWNDMRIHLPDEDGDGGRAYEALHEPHACSRRCPNLNMGIASATSGLLRAAARDLQLATNLRRLKQDRPPATSRCAHRPVSPRTRLPG